MAIVCPRCPRSQVPLWNAILTALRSVLTVQRRGQYEFPSGAWELAFVLISNAMIHFPTLPRLFRTSTFRLALLYMTLFAGSVLLLLVFLYWATAGYMTRQLEETIKVEVRSLAEQYQGQRIDRLINTITQRVEANPHGSFLYLLVNAQQQPLAGNLNQWPLDNEIHMDRWVEFSFWQGNGSNGSAALGQKLQARAQVFQLRGHLYLLVGRDVRELQETRKLIYRALIGGLIFTLWMGLVGGILISYSIMRRIDTINQTSRAIMRGQLSQRMPSSGIHDEFDQLAQNLNSMLDRIEELMAAVRHISDNIAHDLKTPLTRLRNRLEQIAVKPPTWETYQDKINQAIGEADQLLNTFNALLRIARIEAGHQGKRNEIVDLHTLAADAAEFYEVMAEEKAQHFVVRLSPDIQVLGDRDLLFQALLNVLDNAIKYTPEGGTIALDLSRYAEQVCLSVTDNGIGIAVEDREKVLRRFARLETARNTPGNGLGLSLVAAVAELHKAQLKLEDNPQGWGLRVSLIFF